MDIKWSRGERELMYYRSSPVLASRADGLAAPIDTGHFIFCSRV
jgi:hypothetical protein